MNASAEPHALPDYSQGALDALPPAITLKVANELLSLSRNTGYRLAAAGRYPCQVLRVGGEYRVIKADLLRVLGIQAAQVRSEQVEDQAA
ncbi:hypothetical protein ABH937_005446 [Kitasatospora sp. GAS1066B]